MLLIHCFLCRCLRSFRLSFPPTNGPAHLVLDKRCFVLHPHPQFYLLYHRKPRPTFVSIYWLPRFNPNTCRRRSAFLPCFHIIISSTFFHLAVRTKLDADLKLLPAKSITISVRCYETRVGRVNNIQSNVLVDYTKILWSKQDGVEFQQIGNLDFPFRISIPAKVAGFSTAAFVDYRCVWRVEAGTTCSSYILIVAHSLLQ